LQGCCTMLSSWVSRATYTSDVSAPPPCLRRAGGGVAGVGQRHAKELIRGMTPLTLMHIERGSIASGEPLASSPSRSGLHPRACRTVSANSSRTAGSSARCSCHFQVARCAHFVSTSAFTTSEQPASSYTASESIGSSTQHTRPTFP
jgi:hypothetical protein